MGRRRMLRAGAAGFVLVAIAAGACSPWPSAERTPAIRGEDVARRAGCFACHGPAGGRGIPDPSTKTASVPRWDGGAADAYLTSEDEIREWILLGLPRRLAAKPEETRTRTVVPMPAYEGRLSAQDVEDLVAYFRAVSGFGPDMPDAAYEGRVVAARLGCFGCHGPSGMGGVANPGSLTGTIPAWDGEQFAELVRDDTELKEWILDGRPRRLRDDPLARRFLDGQVIRMPGYARHLSDDEVGSLVAYVRWLRARPTAERRGR